jgi:hypothetical protein
MIIDERFARGLKDLFFADFPAEISDAFHKQLLVPETCSVFGRACALSVQERYRPAVSRTAEAHFRLCEDCSESKRFLEEFVHNLRLAAAWEPPARVLEAGLRVFPHWRD